MRSIRIALLCLFAFGLCAASTPSRMTADESSLEKRVGLLERAAEPSAESFDAKTARTLAVGDLKAQASMALSTAEIATITRLQLWFAVFTTIGLGASLYFSWRANNHTRSALRLQASSSEKELRAYLALTEIEVVDVGVGQKPRLNVEFKNFGATPANKIAVQLAIRFADAADDPDFSREAAFPPYSLPPGSSNGSGTKAAAPLTQAQYDRLALPDDVHCDGVLQVTGFVTYWDVFDRERHLEFAAHFYGKQADEHRMTLDRNWAD